MIKKTNRLSDKEIEWLDNYGDDFHTALSKVKVGCIEFKEIIAKLEDIELQIKQLKGGINGNKK